MNVLIMLATWQVQFYVYIHIGQTIGYVLNDSVVPVASLRWVTPGAATEGVAPLFFLKNLATFFAHRCHYHYRFLLLSLGCHPPPRGCHPTPFLPVRPRFSTILCKFAHKLFSEGCHPPGGCHPERSAPRNPLVTPLCCTTISGP